MKTVAILVTLALVANAALALHPKITRSPYVDLWQEWKSQNGREYSSLVEEVSRFEIFVSNAEKVKDHNLRASFGLVSFTLELNHLADLTEEEYRTSRLGLKQALKAPAAAKTHTVGGSVPNTQDWRPKGYVTEVKNQAQCGSCWAFSTTGSFEGQHFNATGNLVSLSEQQLVDCDDYCYGCNGGLMDYGFEYYLHKSPYGAVKEDDYPYTAKDGRCNVQGKQVVATLSSYNDVASRDETALKDASGLIGPISVAIDASHYSFQLYSSGVYYEKRCSQTRLDHGVLVVGYNSDNGEDYWIVKNSWGPSWGQQGYIWMSRNRDNNCGIATTASYPIV